MFRFSCLKLITLILQSIRITNHSNTLIDNIFSNVIDPDIISGNLTATISDHLPQFSIIPNMFGNISDNKSNIYEREWFIFDQGKQAYYDKHFERNWNNIKNTWKGIKFLISLKTVKSSVPSYTLYPPLDNGDNITNPCDIVNTFNNYFASIAKTSKKSIKYSHKLFSDYISNESSSTVFLQPTDNMCSCHSS